MKLIYQTIGKSKHTNKFKIRRFYCELCDVSETIHGDGKYDLVFEGRLAAIEASKILNETL